MEKNPLPKWMTLGADGVSVKLSKPATINSIARDTITLREPRVCDIRAAQKLAKSDDDERELLLFASLAEVSTADLESLPYRDYQRVQEAYFRLIQWDDDPKP